MQSATSRIAEFLRGEKGIEQALDREVAGNMLIAEDAFLYGHFIGKRPPLKIVMPFVRSMPFAERDWLATLTRAVDSYNEEVVLFSDSEKGEWVIAKDGALVQHHPLPLRGNFSSATHFDVPISKAKKINYRLDGSIASYVIEYNGEDVVYKMEDIDDFAGQLDPKNAIFQFAGKEGDTIYIKTTYKPVINHQNNTYAYYLGNTLLGYAIVRMVSTTTIDSTDYYLCTFQPLLGSGAEVLSRAYNAGLEPENDTNYIADFALSKVKTVPCFAYEKIEDSIRYAGTYIHYTGSTKITLKYDYSTGLDPASSMVPNTAVSATAFQNKYVEMFQENGKVVFHIKGQTNDGSGGFQDLDKKVYIYNVYGTIPLWVRNTSRGLVFATECGIFVGAISADGAGFEDINTLTNRAPNRVKPVCVNNFIIYVDLCGRILNSVLFDYTTSNGQVFQVYSFEGLLDQDEEIDKMVLMSNVATHSVFLRTNTGKCYALWFMLGINGTFAGAAVTRIFTNYITHNIEVVRDNSKTDSLYWIGAVGANNFVARLNQSFVPTARQDAREDVCIDLYTDISCDQIAEIRHYQPKANRKWLDYEKRIRITRTSKPGTFEIEHIYVDDDANPLYFTELDVGKRIALDYEEQETFLITALINSDSAPRGKITKASKVLATGSEAFMGGDWVKYKMQFTHVPCMFYLQALATQGFKILGGTQKAEYYGSPSALATDVAMRTADFCFDNFFSNCRIGIEYEMKLTFAPVGNNQSLSSLKKTPKIFTEVVCSRAVNVYCGVLDSSFDERMMAASLANKDEAESDKKWIRRYSATLVGVPQVGCLMPMVKILGSAQAIITCIDVKFVSTEDN